MAGETNISKKLHRPGNSEVDGGEDLLSNLPDSVLCHILSCLPTVTAFRTSVLSREWEYKWTNIYKLEFIDYDLPSSISRRYSGNLKKKERADFANFVEKVLLLCRNVKQFSLLCSSKHDRSRLKTWIAAVLMSNVQSISINYCGELVFPSSFFSYEYLVQLELAHCSFKVPSKVCFPKLRTLTLSHAGLRNDNLSDSSHLFFSFPVLELFKLIDSHCWNVKILKIHAPLLSSLELEYFDMCKFDPSKVCDCGIQISAGRLQIFRFCGCLKKNITFPDISQIIDGSLKLYYLTPKMVSKSRLILGGFSSTIRCLELSAHLITALGHAELLSSLPIFGRLAHLKIHPNWYDKKCIRLLMKLLERAPALEKLMFASVFGYSEKIKLELTNVTSHLKVVEFEGFGFIAEERLLELVKFWLRDSLALEKLIIQTGSDFWFTQLETRFLCYPKVQVIR